MSGVVTPRLLHGGRVQSKSGTYTGSGSVAMKWNNSAIDSERYLSNVNSALKEVASATASHKYTSALYGEALNWKVTGNAGVFTGSAKTSLSERGAVLGSVATSSNVRGAVFFLTGSATSSYAYGKSALPVALGLSARATESESYYGTLTARTALSAAAASSHRYTGTVSSIKVVYVSATATHAYTNSVRGGILHKGAVSGAYVYSGSVTGRLVFVLSATSSSRYTGVLVSRLAANGAVQGSVRYVGTINVTMRKVFFNWQDGKAYRVNQDTAIGGLTQGGLQRNELTSELQRAGLV